MNGKLASSGVFQKGGVSYVPIKDVAAALNLTVAKTARGIELNDSGGANQAEGVNGKIGDVLWNGFARFQVVKVIRTKEYTNQFSGDDQKVTPMGAKNDVYIVVCQLKNGTKNKVTAGLPGGSEIGLADAAGHSYGPRTGLSIDCPSRGQDLLPGAAVDFALTFDVPETAEITDLVYQVTFYGAFDAAAKKFRVTLAK